MAIEYSLKNALHLREIQKIIRDYTQGRMYRNTENEALKEIEATIKAIKIVKGGKF